VTLPGFTRVNVSGAVRIDSRTELVVAADVAERLGLSRARVSVLASRSDFPKPVGRLGRSDVWRWTSVERWARETGRLGQPA
jgi:predicted DNA-binding transcriptional regulator AlpA